MRSVLDAFCASNEGQRILQKLSNRAGNHTHRLRRHDRKYRVGAYGFGEFARYLDPFVKQYSGEEKTFPPGGQLLKILCIELPQRDVASGPSTRKRQCRSPGAAAEHCDALKAHANRPKHALTYTPPCAGGRLRRQRSRPAASARGERHPMGR